LVHVTGTTPQSCSKILTHLFICGDCSPSEISWATDLKRDSVYKALKRLNQFVERKPTGEKNKVKCHLPESNYSKAMRRYGWPRDRNPALKLERKARTMLELAVAPRSEASLFLGQLHRLLNREANEYLFSVMRIFSLPDQLSIIKRLWEGAVCQECLNEGNGFQPTRFDADLQVCVCEKCGVEQKPEVFRAADISENSNERRCRLRSPLPSGIRASLILE